MQRLWLTPVFRGLMRVGLPAFVAAFSAGLYLADDARRAQLTGAVAAVRDEVKNRPAFLVTLLSVDGATPAVAATVRQAMALPLPMSSLDLDLDVARARVEGVAAVADARVRVQPGGVLQVTVREREPAAVWRGPQGLILLDATGHRIAALDARADRADLPLIAGEGADAAVPEALALVMAAGPLLPRLRGLARVGERRWDLVLDRDQRILLPAAAPVAALEAFLARDLREGLLARDVAAADLRLPARPVLRLTQAGLVTLRRDRGLLPRETDL
jgi:cell division protein FtsQ